LRAKKEIALSKPKLHISISAFINTWASVSKEMSGVLREGRG
jgi:hypothetical protein